MSDDTWLDTWLDQHPRIDHAYTRLHMKVWDRVWKVRRFVDVKERLAFARWKVGITYLDHGHEPCVLVKKDRDGTLTGVSLVDGRLIGGCSMYHCGPEMVPLAEARRDADAIRAEKTGETI
jgi:hypothetical protein